MRLRPIDRTAQRLQALGYPRAAARRLSVNGTLLHLDGGSVLCTEGERGTEAFLLLDGEADVLLADAEVRVGPGAVIGEQATLDHRRRRNATVTAHGPIEVLVYDVATYRGLARRDDLRRWLVPERVAA